MVNPTLELWRLRKVAEKTGLSKPTIYRRIEAGTFPASYQIGANSVAWRSDEIIAWMNTVAPPSGRAHVEAAR